MAHERQPGDERASYSAATPYPTNRDYEYMPDSRQYQAPSPNTIQTPHPYDIPIGRARTQSSAQRPVGDPFRPQGVYDAVSDAFDQSPASNALPHDVIRQITEQITEKVRSQVIDSLKKDGYSSAASTAAPPASAPPPQTAFPPPPTNTIPKRESPPARGEYVNGPPLSHGGSGRSSPSSARVNGVQPEQSDSFIRDAYANTNGDSKSTSRDSKLEMKENIASRYGDRSEAETVPRRPTIPSLKTDDEPTTLEKIWQPLFDVNGEPTERLGQFLRGLALHIIDDYEPKSSLVIPPAKLEKFYEDVKLDDETYPWHNIFKLNSTAMAKIYRDMKIEHFYIQEHISEPPAIPALTPVGFQRWMTLHMQAHPEAEFKRLQQAVRHMPINNADDPKERFPKELSRRLLPKYDDIPTRQYCSAALSADGQITLPKHTTFPPPPPPPLASASQSTSELPTSFGDRERTPYAAQSTPNLHDSAIQSDTTDEGDDDTMKPSVPIERERKPYIAKEGSGKIYENDTASSSRTLRPETLSTTNANASASANASGKHRPNSMYVDREGNFSDASSRASDYTATSVPHRSRTYSKSSASQRRRSPTFTGGYVKSDGSVDGIPSGQYASNLYYDGRVDEERYRDRDRDRDRERERERERDRDGVRDRSERRDRDRDERDRRDSDRRDRDERDRERERERERRDWENRERERERREKEEYLRRMDEEERRLSRYDGEPISRRSTVESGYPGPAYGQYPPPLGTGERRYA